MKTIEVQPTLIDASGEWNIFVSKYIQTYVVKSGGIFCDHLIWCLEHAQKQANLIHTISMYLFDHKAQFAKEPCYSYLLLESAFINSVYTYREALEQIINEIYQCDIDFEDMDAIIKLLNCLKKKAPDLYKILNEMGPKSVLFEFIDKYRNPYVHKVHLEEITTIEDITKSLIGFEQPRIVDFITKCHELSVWLKDRENKFISLLEVRLFGSDKQTV